MYRTLFLFLSLCLIGAAPKRPVIVTIVPAPPMEVTAGTEVQYPLELKILKGYHIQSNPASEKYLIPVTARLEAVDGITLGNPIYPPGAPWRLKGSSKDISTYEDAVHIKIPLKVVSTFEKGEIELKGTLRYQGCDAILCFPPAKLPFEVKLKIS